MTVGQGSPHVRTSAPLACPPNPYFLCESWQGSVQTIYLGLALSLLNLCCGPGSAFGQALPSGPQAANDSVVQCELRVVWGGEVPRPYAGAISIASGTLKVVRNLSLQQDSIGTIENASFDRIELQPHSPCTFGGVDIELRGQLDSLLSLRFDDPLGGKPREFQVALAELLEGEWLQALDDRGNRLAIGRQMVDRLRVVSGQEPRILAPGQMWRLTIAGHRTGLSAGGATAELRFVSEDGQTLGHPQLQTLTIDEQGNFPATVVELPAPLQEGAYHLEIALQRRHMLNSFVASQAPLLRRLDLVVFDAQATPQVIAGWQPLATIDPLRASKPGSLAWLASMEVLPTMGRSGSLAMTDKLQSYNPLAGAMNQPISHGG